jgi:nicotinamidase-related amidase
VGATSGRDWSPFALLLIDVQKDFWSEKMTATFPDFENNVSGLLATCRSEGMDVVHLRARFKPDKSDWMVKYLFRDGIPCVEGTPGESVFPCASEVPAEPVFYKQTFDGFLNPDLHNHLQVNGKRFLLVAGLVTSVCVLLTSAAAAQRGYLVAVVEDCCADQPEAHRHTLSRYPFVFDRVNATEIVSSLEQWQSLLGPVQSRG